MLDNAADIYIIEAYEGRNNNNERNKMREVYQLPHDVIMSAKGVSEDIRQSGWHHDYWVDRFADAASDIANTFDLPHTEEVTEAIEKIMWDYA